MSKISPRCRWRHLAGGHLVLELLPSICNFDDDSRTRFYLNMLCAVAYLGFQQEWRGAVGVEASGVCWRGLGPFPECPQNDKFGCIMPQFLTGRKHGQLPEAFGHGFYGSAVKQSLRKRYKIYPKIHGQTKGGRSHYRSLNTPLALNKRRLCYGKMSVRLSVTRRSGIVSKELNISS